MAPMVSEPHTRTLLGGPPKPQRDAANVLEGKRSFESGPLSLEIGLGSITAQEGLFIVEVSLGSIC